MKCEWKPVRDWDDKENKNIDYGAAWSVFGKWIKGAPEKTDIVRAKSNKALKGTGHICIVLRGTFFTIYYYELTTKLNEDQRKIFEEMRIMFDKVLMANQAVIEILSKKSNKRLVGMTGQGIFPEFFNKYDPQVIIEHSDKIEAEIEEWSNKKYEYRKTRRSVELERFSKSKRVTSIKRQYGQLLSMLNTLRPTLPDVKNMNIIDTIIERCEYGYHLGYLVDLKLRDIKDRNINRKGLITKANKYREGRETKVKKAALKAFERTPKLIRRLNRMFVFEKVK